jgi:hypothetical protein
MRDGATADESPLTLALRATAKRCADGYALKLHVVLRGTTRARSRSGTWLFPPHWYRAAAA